MHDQRLAVLCVTSRYPEPARTGIDVRVSWLLRALQAIPGASVTLAAVAPHELTDVRQLVDVPCLLERADPQPTSMLLRWGRAVARRTPVWILARQSTALGHRLKEVDADVIVVLDDAAASMLRLVDDAVPVVLDKHNVLTWLTATACPGATRRVQRAVRDWLHLWMTRRYELRVLARANAVTVTSPQDVERLRETLGARAAGIVPSSSVLSTTPWVGGTDVGVLGAMDVQPNMDGLVRLLDGSGDALSRLRIRLRIAGQLPPGGVACAVPEGAELHGYVDDLDGWLSTLAALVVPLWWGSGIKTKTVTAMAAGVPVVSTPEGVEGLDVADGVHCLVRSSPVELLTAAVELRDDRERARSIGGAGQRLVSDLYSVERSARVLRDAIDDAMRGARPLVDRL